MDEHGNGLTGEMIEILTDIATEGGGSFKVSYRQCGNEEIAIHHEWDFKPSGWTDDATPRRMLRTIDAWDKIRKLHPKKKLQGVKLNAPEATIRWVQFQSLDEFYYILEMKMEEEAPFENQKGSNDKDN
mgnify:CR=1 FL=1